MSTIAKWIMKAPGMRGEWACGGGCDVPGRRQGRHLMIAKGFIPKMGIKTFAIMENPVGRRDQPAGRERELGDLGHRKHEEAHGASWLGKAGRIRLDRLLADASITGAL